MHVALLKAYFREYYTGINALYEIRTTKYAVMRIFSKEQLNRAPSCEN